MTEEQTKLPEWSGWVRVVTYGLTDPSWEPNIEHAFGAIMRRKSGPGHLAAIEEALASDLDLAALLNLRHPDSVVRDFLRALHARLEAVPEEAWREPTAWSGRIREVTSSLEIPPPLPPMRGLDNAYALVEMKSEGPAYRAAIDAALASDVDLSEMFALAHPDSVVREFLRALLARLV